MPKKQVYSTNASSEMMPVKVHNLRETQRMIRDHECAFTEAWKDGFKHALNVAFDMRTLLKLDFDEDPPPETKGKPMQSLIVEGSVRKGGVNPESETPRPDWKPVSMKGKANA